MYSESRHSEDGSRRTTGYPEAANVRSASTIRRRACLSELFEPCTPPKAWHCYPKELKVPQGYEPIIESSNVVRRRFSGCTIAKNGQRAHLSELLETCTPAEVTLSHAAISVQENLSRDVCIY